MINVLQRAKQKSFDKRDFGPSPEAVRQRAARPCERPQLLIMDLISQRGTTLATPRVIIICSGRRVGGADEGWTR